MPFPFVLPTTSHLTLQAHLTSSTHPSLPAATTSQRNTIRSILKSQKRLPPQDQASNLNNIVSNLTEYLKYLLSLDAALSGRSIAGEDVEIALTKEIEVEWRPTLASSNIPGKSEVERVKGRGLDYEIYFVHQTYAVVQNLLARQSLLGLYASVNPTSEQRVALIQNAIKHLKSAYSIHKYLTVRSNLSPDGPPSSPPLAVDISAPIQSALLHITHAEINLNCVLKDDPYPAILVQSRNVNDKEWMIKAPDIPKTRSQVLTRLCIGAADHASTASATLKSEGGRRVSKDLIEYVDSLRSTARARACRFQAIDHDSTGQTGTAIAWLRAGMNELDADLFSSVSSSQASSTMASTTTTADPKEKSLSSLTNKLKQTYLTKREDKKIQTRSPTWGSDAGKLEEGRILTFLDRKYTKANDTINIQIVPEWRPLLGLLPSGMNMPVEVTSNSNNNTDSDLGGSSGGTTTTSDGSVNGKWQPGLLSEEELTVMRAPMGYSDRAYGNANDGSVPGGLNQHRGAIVDDSSDDDDDIDDNGIEGQLALDGAPAHISSIPATSLTGSGAGARRRANNENVPSTAAGSGLGAVGAFPGTEGDYNNYHHNNNNTKRSLGRQNQPGTPNTGAGGGGSTYY